jgi:hypothetical protein
VADLRPLQVALLWWLALVHGLTRLNLARIGFVRWIDGDRFVVSKIDEAGSQAPEAVVRRRTNDLAPFAGHVRK